MAARRRDRRSALALGLGLLWVACAGESTGGSRDGGLIGRDAAQDGAPDAFDARVDADDMPPIVVPPPADAGGDARANADASAPDDASAPNDASTPDDASAPDDASTPEDASIPEDSAMPEPDATIPDPSTCTPWSALVEPDAVICEQEPPPDIGPFGNRVALTFDDGPNPTTTPAVLAILRAEQIPATFFVVGQRLQTPQARELAREIHRDPLFRVANHTFTHARLPTTELAQVALQIDDTSAAIRTAVEDPCYFPRFMRFPFSDSDCATMQVARERGYAVAGLHIDPADWCFARNAGYCAPADAAWVPELYRNDMIGFVLSQLPRYGGGIVLLHDIHANTVANLQALIDALQAAGVLFVALDDEEHFPLLNAQLEVPPPPACCQGVTR
jgi:peptidoglycan/xylan/chitin deacetylase (PgdA/CDA1 family)